MGLVWLLLALVVLAEAIVYVTFLLSARVVAKGLRRTLVLAVALGVTPVVVLALYVRLAPLDSPYSLSQLPGWQVIDANGVVLQRETGDGLRVPVSLEEVAPVMVDATIAAEDERFRDHGGIDPIAVGRALVQLPFHRSGASTLTQQLARRLYIDESTPLLERKAREALTALQLEARYSKDEILSLYLNNVYYGRGAYGVEAAARVYFGVSAANLDLAQASFLAGLPQRPVEFGESVDSSGVVDRQRYVLRRLAETHCRQAWSRIDPKLNIVEPALKSQLRAELAEANRPEDLQYYAPWFRWYYNPWQQSDLLDDRVRLSAEALAKGVYEFIYYARATTPGDFFAAPSHVEESYFPEVFGRGDSARFVVQP